jgi:hypothetical protein
MLIDEGKKWPLLHPFCSFRINEVTPCQQDRLETSVVSKVANAERISMQEEKQPRRTMLLRSLWLTPRNSKSTISHQHAKKWAIGEECPFPLIVER